MSDKHDDGGPAYPSEQSLTPEGLWNQTQERGMSLRDVFAKDAMVAFLQMTVAPGVSLTTDGKRVPGWDLGTAAKVIAEMAYDQAEAMIAEMRRRKQACQGISTEALEAGAIKELVDVCGELLAFMPDAKVGIEEYGGDSDARVTPIENRANAVLAKIEGAA